MAPNPPRTTLNTLLSYCAEYSDSHREFMQFLMQRRYVECSRVGEIFLDICNSVENNRLRALNGTISPEDNQQVLECLLQSLNPKLSPLGLRVVQVANEYARRMDYLVLVSELHFSNGLRSSGPLSGDELAMFYQWLQLIFAGYRNQEEGRQQEESEDEEAGREGKGGENRGTGELTVSRALVHAKRKGGWTMQRAQKLVDRLKADCWIQLRTGARGDGGVISLHPRAVAELEPVLLNNLRVPSCALCKHPIVVSRLSHKCASCESSFHGSCMLRELEFPSPCPSEECEEMLEEELLEMFEWDPDGMHIPPRRSNRRSTTTGTVNRSRTRQSQRATTSSANNSTFAMLRDD